MNWKRPQDLTVLRNLTHYDQVIFTEKHAFANRKRVFLVLSKSGNGICGST